VSVVAVVYVFESEARNYPRLGIAAVMRFGMNERKSNKLKRLQAKATQVKSKCFKSSVTIIRKAVIIELFPRATLFWARADGLEPGAGSGTSKITSHHITL